MTYIDGGKFIPIALIAGFLSCTISGSLKADDWPFFRGPYNDGVSREDQWDAEFTDSEPRILWRRDVGIGASSMIVVGDYVLTMGSNKGKDQDVVYCLNVDNGEVVWDFSYHNKFDNRMFDGGTAATPTADEGCVYTLSYNGHLHCLNLIDGSVIWKKNVIDDLGGEPPQWKYAGSPCVVGDLLIQDIGGDNNSIIALEKKTGEKVWGTGKGKPGYAPAIPFKDADKDAVLIFRAKNMTALNCANGEELWNIPWETAYDVNASSPSIFGDKLYISSGYASGRGALFQISNGDPKKIWENNDIKTKMSSCVIYKGHVYGISEKKSVLMCINMLDGSTVWAQPNMSQYGTLTIAGDKLIIMTDFGQLVIAQANSAGYVEISRAKILEGQCWVTPILANGRIFCRSNQGDLVCIDVRK